MADGPDPVLTVPAFARGTIAREAFEFACSAHAGQTRRGDGAPYISHPRDVAELVAAEGGDPAMVAAAFLHDVLEDTGTEPARLQAELGADVGSLVIALTDNRHIEAYEERKAALRAQVEAAGARAIAIYLCDKVANVRDLRRLYELEGEAIGPRYKAPIEVRIAIWRADLEMARRRLGETSLAAELESDLDAIERSRATAAGGPGSPEGGPGE